MIIEKKIEYWKNKLLDLSKRNKMINFPELKIGKRVSRSWLIINDPSIHELWRTLVIDEESLKFPIEEVKYYENNEDDQNRLSDNDCFSTGIRTNQSCTEACKTLIKLKQRSREFMDNKGMNALFLVFGFLHWKENGIEGQEMRSPLILVPVTIMQSKLTDPIFLSKSDEDPICNIALQQKLNNDFNISLPEYEDNMDIAEYLTNVEMMCKNVGWSVESDSAVLSMLNYLKMPMYIDIQAHEDIIKNHFLVRTLNGETSFYDYDSIPDLKRVDHDKIDPRSVYSVVDADSSQQDAIYLAKNGTSFVLQGPPGTGKSQTITNIIAELLGQGKKVLFVSEKMAALQVVYRRLVSTGLGAFCLTLHNPNAKRKEIIEQLETSMNLLNSKVVISNDAIRKLKELETAREELNDYVKQVNQTISPLDDTIYHVNGVIAKYDSFPDIDYVHENADKVTPEELLKMENALSEFVRIIEIQGYQSDNPWVGCTERNINHIFRQRFNARVAEIISFLDQGINLCEEILSIIRGNNHIENEEFFYSTIKGYEELLLSASFCKGVPREWYNLDTDKLLEDINNTLELIKNNEQEQNRINSVILLCRDMTYAASKILEYAIADDVGSINKSIKELNSNYDNLAEHILKSKSFEINQCKNSLLLYIQQFIAVLTKVNQLNILRNDFDSKISQIEKEIEAQNQFITDCNSTFEDAKAVLVSNKNEMFISAEIKPLYDRFRWLAQNGFGEDYNIVANDVIRDSEKLFLYDTGLSELIKSYKNLLSDLKEIYLQKKTTIQKSKDASAEIEHQKNIYADLQLSYATAISKVKADNNSEFLTINLANIKSLFHRIMNSPFDENYKMYAEVLIKELGVISFHVHTSLGLIAKEFIEGYNSLILCKSEEENLIIELKTIKSRIEEQLSVLSKNEKEFEGANSLLFASYMENILSLDVSGIKTRIDVAYQSSFRSFKPQYIKDIKTIKSFSKNNDQLTYDSFVLVINRILDAQDRKKKIDDQRDIVSELEIKEQDCIKRRDVTTDKILRQQGFIKNLCSRIMRLLDTIIYAQNQSEALKKQSNLIDELGHQLISCTDEEDSINVNIEQLQDRIRRICKDILLQFAAIEDAQNKHKVVKDHITKVSELKQKQDLARLERGKILDHITEKQNELFKEKDRIKVSVDKLIEILKQASEQQESEFKKLSEKYLKAFDAISSEIGITVKNDTEMTSIHDDIKWLCEFKNYTVEQKANDAFISNVLKAEDDYIKLINSLYQEMASWNSRFPEQVKFFMDLFDQDHRNGFLELSIQSLKATITDCRQNTNLLETYISYKNVVDRMNQNGLGDYVLIVEKQRLDSKAIIPAFKKCFYRSWLDKITENLTGISSFRRDSHEERIERFKALDVSHIKISREILKRKLVDGLPYMDFIGRNEESSILKREMKKKKRFMPIRRLVNALPSLLPALKPCMMMSPISVSTYFGQSNYEFDTVIFDEASQICTEDAICSIFRAKQVIIAGDSKQLPPTNFFSSSFEYNDEEDEDDDAEEFDDVGAYESLLDEASVFPSQTLLWHYRSKHEHLIAFSNYKIYESNLITFPSSVDEGNDIGVEYVYVSDGVYNKRGNIKEAQKIVELLANHFINYPERSVGIITFSINQQSVIENEVLKLRQTRPEFEEFFKEDIDEPFFIRSLESVQGDERDTIIMSICYGKAPDGKIRMNFGPLSKDGGERRLNVAVTRARFNMKLVGSILPTDLNLSNTTTQGPKLLRDYIDFAINGEQVLKGDNTVSDEIVFDSPFEESVYDFLVGRGYRVATQVGCSGYRIDMAVYHPEYNGRFVIGIECDGASYHSARTARERDRVRQTILEDMGWKFYRIWSTDWIKDPEYEKNRLVEAVERAILVYHENIPESIQNNSDENDYSEVIEVTTKTSVSEPEKDYSSKFIGSKPLDIPISDYKETVINMLSMGYGRNQKESLIKTAAKLAYGWDRVGSNIRKQFNKAITALEKDGKIEVVGDMIKLV